MSHQGSFSWLHKHLICLLGETELFHALLMKNNMAEHNVMFPSCNHIMIQCNIHWSTIDNDDVHNLLHIFKGSHIFVRQTYKNVSKVITWIIRTMLFSDSTIHYFKVQRGTTYIEYWKFASIKGIYTKGNYTYISWPM